jgi:DNA-binding LytR/AlgR family response regulator
LIGYKNTEALKKQLFQVKKINEKLKIKAKVRTAHDLISFYSENGKFEIKLFVHDILFVKSEGNYLEIYYMNNESTESKHLIRNRLKNVSDILPSEVFFQCHKSYVVNLEKINRVDGNARDLNLYVYGISHKIPVSRGKSSGLLSFLKK